MTAKHQVSVPALPGQSPFLTLTLTIPETLNVIERLLERSAASGHLSVEFRTTRHPGGRGVTTVVHCVEALGEGD